MNLNKSVSLLCAHFLFKRRKKNKNVGCFDDSNITVVRFNLSESYTEEARAPV